MDNKYKLKLTYKPDSPRNVRVELGLVLGLGIRLWLGFRLELGSGFVLRMRLELG